LVKRKQSLGFFQYSFDNSNEKLKKKRIDKSLIEDNRLSLKKDEKVKFTLIKKKLRTTINLFNIVKKLRRC
jgi:hypothetical protein